MVVSFDTPINISGLNYLTFTLTSSSNYNRIDYVRVGLSNDKTSASFVDYVNISGRVSTATEYTLNISEITDSKYLKVAVSRTSDSGAVTISNIKLTKSK